jgi:zinc transporter ZupT
MLSFSASFLAWLVSTLVPAFLGMTVIVAASKFVGPRYLTAFAFGIFLWFFVDTIGDAADLDVSSGLSGGIDQVVTVALFAIGLLFLFSLDRSVFSLDLESQSSSVLVVPILVAVAVGIHGFGEGVAFGYTAASTSSASLVDAFGGLSAGAAYVLHKALEPMMIAACYVSFAKRPSGPSRTLREVVFLTLIFVIPSLLGDVAGYYVVFDSTYFFALGTGSSIYAAIRLAGPLFRGPERADSNDSLKTALWLVFGFLCIYSAALLHS